LASDNAFGLLKKGSDLCFSCHAPIKALLQAKSVHSPFAEGKCASCHAPHASGFAAQLVADPKVLCLKCHDAKAPKFVQMHRRLPVANIECGSCHNPHGSDQPSLIRSKPHAVSQPAAAATTSWAEASGVAGEGRTSASSAIRRSRSSQKPGATRRSKRGA
jgi:predicted CXXCH cytochrome family protein